MKGGDGSSYEKTYSQLISNNNFKEKGRLGSGDKTTATHEKVFTLMYVFLKNMFCLSPLFPALKAALSSSPSSPGQQL